MLGGKKGFIEDNKRKLGSQKRLDNSKHFDLTLGVHSDHELEQRLQMEGVGYHLVKHVEHTGNLLGHVGERMRQKQEVVDE